MYTTKDGSLFGLFGLQSKLKKGSIYFSSSSVYTSWWTVIDNTFDDTNGCVNIFKISAYTTDICSLGPGTNIIRKDKDLLWSCSAAFHVNKE